MSAAPSLVVKPASSLLPQDDHYTSIHRRSSSPLPLGMASRRQTHHPAPPPLNWQVLEDHHPHHSSHPPSCTLASCSTGPSSPSSTVTSTSCTSASSSSSSLSTMGGERRVRPWGAAASAGEGKRKWEEEMDEDLCSLTSSCSSSEAGLSGPFMDTSPSHVPMEEAILCLPSPKRHCLSSCLPTGLVCDHEAFGRHRHPQRRHPERPERLTVILQHLESKELLPHLTHYRASHADHDDLMAVHNKHYLERLRRLESAPLPKLLEEADQFDSVYFNESSVSCAKQAAGALTRLVQEVVEGRLANGMALIRPPGHHAEAHHARGFCIINNVAVAASYARRKLGVNKVLIVDWDVHHGQGTQRIFLEDPSVLYFSVHRYDNGQFFPGGKDASPCTVGKGEGEGFTVNVGWNQGGMGDAEYMEVWRRVLKPIAMAYQPDLVLVSAGFDGVKGDEIGGCDVTPECFGNMTRELLSLAQGRVVLALEGGYKLSVLPQCVEACLLALMEHSNNPSPINTTTTTTTTNDDDDNVRPEALESIQATIEAHRRYWPCLMDNNDHTTTTNL